MSGAHFLGFHFCSPFIFVTEENLLLFLEPCKKGWTSWDAGLRVDSGGEGGRNHVLDGVQIPKGEGNLWGWSYPLKALWITVVVYAAKKINSSKKIINASAWPLQSTMLLPTCRSHINFPPPWKIRPVPQRCDLIKILWPIILSLSMSRAGVSLLESPLTDEDRMRLAVDFSVWSKSVLLLPLMLVVWQDRHLPIKQYDLIWYIYLYALKS